MLLPIKMSIKFYEKVEPTCNTIINMTNLKYPNKPAYRVCQLILCAMQPNQQLLSQNNYEKHPTSGLRVKS